MKTIKLTGRERAVLRAIDFSTGSTGEEIMTRTNIDADELVDILNSLISVGYAEVVPYAEATTYLTFRESTFEVNPSYALDLREAMKR